MQIWDDTTRYGMVSRGLHWGMALLLLWQFASAGAHLLLEDTAIEQFLWPTHRSSGSLLFLLIWVRLIWAVANRARRPPSVSRAATFGHYLMYALLLLTPSLGLLRQYGGGREFAPFGIPLFPGTGTRVEWMVAPGNLLHSWFGWTLLALIIGHIVMAWWHRRSARHTDILPRMWR